MAAFETTHSFVVKAVEAAENLADDGAPSGDVSDLALAIEGIEVVEDVEAQRDKALEDARPACLSVRSRILIHAQKVVYERRGAARLLFEQVGQLLHEALRARTKVGGISAHRTDDRQSDGVNNFRRTDFPQGHPEVLVGVEPASKLVAVLKNGEEAKKVLRRDRRVHLGVLQKLVRRLDKEELEDTFPNNLAKHTPAVGDGHTDDLVLRRRWRTVGWHRSCRTKMGIESARLGARVDRKKRTSSAEIGRRLERLLLRPQIRVEQHVRESALE